MAWLAVDKSKQGWVFESKPERDSWSKIWLCGNDRNKQGYCLIERDEIENLIGKKLSWDDEPYQI